MNKQQWEQDLRSAVKLSETLNGNVETYNDLLQKDPEAAKLVFNEPVIPKTGSTFYYDPEHIVNRIQTEIERNAKRDEEIRESLRKVGLTLFTMILSLICTGLSYTLLR